MHNSLTNPGGWTNSIDTVDADELEDLDAKTASAINGDDGGAWAPTDPIEIGGDGVDLQGANHKITGTQTVASGGVLSVASGGLIDVENGGEIDLAIGTQMGLGAAFLVPLDQAAVLLDGVANTLQVGQVCKVNAADLSNSATASPTATSLSFSVKNGEHWLVDYDFSMMGSTGAGGLHPIITCASAGVYGTWTAVADIAQSVDSSEINPIEGQARGPLGTNDAELYNVSGRFAVHAGADASCTLTFRTHTDTKSVTVFRNARMVARRAQSV